MGKIEIGYTVEKERWLEAAQNLHEFGQIMARNLRNMNREGRGQEDADDLMADIILACTAIGYVGVCRGSMPVYPYAGRWPEMSEQKRPEICEYCALGDHDAYICARWRLSYAVNELKKAVPLLRRTAEKQMKCPYYYPAGLLKTGLVIMDEIGPWPPERKGR